MSEAVTGGEGAEEEAVEEAELCARLKAAFGVWRWIGWFG